MVRKLFLLSLLSMSTAVIANKDVDDESEETTSDWREMLNNVGEKANEQAGDAIESLKKIFMLAIQTQATGPIDITAQWVKGNQTNKNNLDLLMTATGTKQVRINGNPNAPFVVIDKSGTYWFRPELPDLAEDGKTDEITPAIAHALARHNGSIGTKEKVVNTLAIGAQSVLVVQLMKTAAYAGLGTRVAAAALLVAVPIEILRRAGQNYLHSVAQRDAAKLANQDVEDDEEEKAPKKKKKKAKKA